MYKYVYVIKQCVHTASDDLYTDDISWRTLNLTNLEICKYKKNGEGE